MNSITINHEVDLNDYEFGWWFAGYADGEGCFRIGVQKFSFVPEFSITSRADEKPLLEYAKAKLGNIGRLDYKKKGKWVGSGGHIHNPTVGWQIRSYIDLSHSVIPLFDKYPLKSKKGLEYRQWREAVLLMYEHHKRYGRVKRPHQLDLLLAKIAKHLHTLKKGNLSAEEWNIDGERILGEATRFRNDQMMLF